MTWGMTNLISAEHVCQVYGDIATRGGYVLHVQLVVVETAQGLVGSTSAPASVEWYRMFYSIPDEKTDGDEKPAEDAGSGAPGSEPGGFEGG